MDFGEEIQPKNEVCSALQFDSGEVNFSSHSIELWLWEHIVQIQYCAYKVFTKITVHCSAYIVNGWSVLYT